MRRALPAGLRPAGRLDDGTAFYAPMGEIPYDPDEDRVQCHLCGGWYRIIGGTHLSKVHGWQVQEYRERFGLLNADATCARGLSRRLADLATGRIASGEFKAPPIRQPTRRVGRKTPYRKSLAALRPELVAELDADRNPPEVTSRSVV